MFSKFFVANRAVFWKNVEKYCTVRPQNDNMAYAHWMLDK